MVQRLPSQVVPSSKTIVDASSLDAATIDDRVEDERLSVKESRVKILKWYLRSRGLLHAAHPSSRTKKRIFWKMLAAWLTMSAKRTTFKQYHQSTKPASEASTTGTTTPSKTSDKWGVNKPACSVEPAEHTAQRP